MDNNFILKTLCVIMGLFAAILSFVSFIADANTIFVERIIPGYTFLKWIVILILLFYIFKRKNIFCASAMFGIFFLDWMYRLMIFGEGTNVWMVIIAGQMVRLVLAGRKDGKSD